MFDKCFPANFDIATYNYGNKYNETFYNCNWVLLSSSINYYRLDTAANKKTLFEEDRPINLRTHSWFGHIWLDFPSENRFLKHNFIFNLLNSCVILDVFATFHFASAKITSRNLLEDANPIDVFKSNVTHMLELFHNTYFITKSIFSLFLLEFSAKFCAETPLISETENSSYITNSNWNSYSGDLKQDW